MYLPGEDRGKVAERPVLQHSGGSGSVLLKKKIARVHSWTGARKKADAIPAPAPLRSAPHAATTGGNRNLWCWGPLASWVAGSGDPLQFTPPFLVLRDTGAGTATPALTGTLRKEGPKERAGAVIARRLHRCTPAALKKR